ncbi:unnamed protein product [Ranitomeya imitator]|uniref:BACK domain-containing protein n=1 Tax=Ranitomeya imitator TaxID=111125 RepID=A0ABN9LRX5_9NEOB|nr:unnamed protein product [Ranitomeya imitator]
MNVLLDFMYGGNPNIEEDNSTGRVREISCPANWTLPTFWGIMKFADMLSIISLSRKQEETVYEAVRGWVKENKSRGREALKDLLEHVRLPLMDFPLFFWRRLKWIRPSKNVQSVFPLLHEARRYLILENH